MSQHGPQNLNEVSTDKTKNRRKFIKKGGAGLLLASLPVASVWGQDSLIAGSIIASGNGSDFSGGKQIKLVSPGYWKNHANDWRAYSSTDSFASMFGGAPLGVLKKAGSNLTISEASETSLIKILHNPGTGKNGLGGPGNVNCFMICIVLCAANHGRFVSGQQINFPVIKGSISYGQVNRGLFNTLSDFARYLYGKGLTNASGLGAELSDLVDKNHA